MFYRLQFLKDVDNEERPFSIRVVAGDHFSPVVMIGCPKWEDVTVCMQDLGATSRVVSYGETATGPISSYVDESLNDLMHPLEGKHQATLIALNTSQREMRDRIGVLASRSLPGVRIREFARILA
jgi:hypothetical protein